VVESQHLPLNPPVCEEADYDCERRQEEYNVFCVNGKLNESSLEPLNMLKSLRDVLLFINVFLLY
jgi:hypothetical protein